MRIIGLAVLTILIGCSTPKKNIDIDVEVQGAKVKSAAQALKKRTASSTDATLSVSCSLDNDHRQIQSIKKTDGKGCEVSYLKWKETSVIGSANNDMDHCKRIVEKVKVKLETAGFTCK